ncbi:MAG: hypothetical protein OEZ58_14840 [Gammaproteobacteria bacterium]|nr:hypothetical protein [Gammaproteobacteria bacterium]MDH5730271.1 hypothetical protein [Gammaproteobacteria bacterium]
MKLSNILFSLILIYSLTGCFKPAWDSPQQVAENQDVILNDEVLAALGLTLWQDMSSDLRFPTFLKLADSVAMEYEVTRAGGFCVRPNAVNNWQVIDGNVYTDEVIRVRYELDNQIIKETNLANASATTFEAYSNCEQVSIWDGVYRRVGNGKVKEYWRINGDLTQRFVEEKALKCFQAIQVSEWWMTQNGQSANRIEVVFLDSLQAEVSAQLVSDNKVDIEKLVLCSI